jgi:hypothetical protein
MASMGIDSFQTRPLARGGAPASKPVPTTTHGSGESTKRDKGKAATHCIYIPTHPDDYFGRGICE